MPAARTFSPPITAKAATRSDTLKMIALTRLDMMMRISFVLDVAGPLLAYLHYISTFGCAPLVPGCKSGGLAIDYWRPFSRPPVISSYRALPRQAALRG